LNGDLKQLEKAHRIEPVEMPAEEFSAPPKKVRILLVDDHSVVREGLMFLLNREKGFSVCGEADTVQGALAAIAEKKPDLVITDLLLGNRDGIELLKEIRNRDPDLPVLFLSMIDDVSYAERAIRAGANGYVTKQRGASELLTAIRTVLQNEIHVSSHVASFLLRKLAGARPSKRANATDQLSDRELQVLRCIGQGLSVRDIAEQLFLSPKTIESHRENIKRKLNLSNGGELLKYAIEHTRVAG
jgi:DNA-binding NarL/FixJ family response regulator